MGLTESGKVPGNPHRLPKRHVTPLELTGIRRRPITIFASDSSPRTPATEAQSVVRVTDLPRAEETEGLPRFTTNSGVDTVRRLIETRKPDWNRLAAQVKKTPGSMQLRSLHGKFAELHVENLFITGELPADLKRACKVNPLDGVETENFAFQRKKDNNLYVIDKRSRQAVAEIDLVMEVYDLPTIIEVKAVSHSNKYLLDSAYDNALRADQCRRYFAPFQEYYGADTEFAYLVVTTPERISPKSELQHQFRDTGALLVGMNARLSDFRSRASDLLYPSRRT